MAVSPDNPVPPVPCNGRCCDGSRCEFCDDGACVACDADGCSECVVEDGERRCKSRPDGTRCLGCGKCAGGACLVADPAACGACGRCDEKTLECTSGCAAGTGGVRAGQTCCNGRCCGADQEWECCGGLTCCPTGQCCEGHCCPEGYTCCNGECCHAESRHCSNGVCCQKSDFGCRGSEVVSCCIDGMTCCGDGRCVWEAHHCPGAERDTRRPGRGDPRPRG